MVFRYVMVLEGYRLDIDDVLGLVGFLRNQMKPYKRHLTSPYPNLDELKKKSRKIGWVMDNMNDINRILKKKFRGVQLYTPPCCSSLNFKIFILGECIKQYERIVIGCERCSGTYYCCDECLGATENGYYDMEKILHGLVEVDNKSICKWCHNDKKGEAACKFCNREELMERGFARRPPQCYCEQPITKIDKWMAGKPRKYYYMLDDCMTCS